MRDMQRWALDYDVMIEEEEGQWVKAADAEAAIAAARAEAVAEHIALADKVWVDMLAKAEAAAEQRGWDVGYDAGRRDERAELRDPGTAATRGAYEQGQRDMLARLTSEEAHAVIVKVLNDEGAMSEGGWHGWRCFDKGRYPEPCRCTEYVVDEVLSALRALQEKT